MWGALLQEAIDVAVILNAQRALRPHVAAIRLAPEVAALSRRFQTEHEAIRTHIEELRGASDCLGIVNYPEALGRIYPQFDKLLDSAGEPPPR